ncbi:MAG: hypothetical protein HY794_06620 [Desulfarculus sp.]|nr:hypothetical protein [Desulfarculus sp.]
MANSSASKQWTQGFIQMNLKWQWLSIRVQWEPALTRALGQAAGDCLALVRQELDALAASPDTPPDWPALTARLAKAWAMVVSTRSQAAKALLLAMVKEVVAETGQVLTLNGLAGDAPDLHSPGQDPRAALEALAGGPALDQAVAKSFREFGGLLAGQLRQAAAGGLEPAELWRCCQPIARHWRARLEMIARTVAHEVFNRARVATFEKLP